MHRKTIILVNTGTPEEPEKKAVRKYLSEFLNDPFVIDIPWILRKILVNLIIIPFRTAKSVGLYKRLWTEKGSPLRTNLERLVSKLNERLKDEYIVAGAMRYGKPSIRSVLQRTEKGSEIIIFPLFPQYAAATTGSVKRAVLNELANSGASDVRFIDQFYSQSSFIDALSKKIKQCQPQNFDHIIFSYHSLPVRQVNKIHPAIQEEKCNCIDSFPSHGKQCYKAECYMTTRLLADKLGLEKDSFSTTFQSRMSKNWISPFTDKAIRDLAAMGKKHLLIASPSFVADCLETLIEIREDYKDIFFAAGGEKLEFVDSLNYDDIWVEAIIRILASPEQSRI